MAKGALYWRLKDESTGKWTYQRVPESELHLTGKQICGNMDIITGGE